jgi:hypothetical protein
MVDQSKAKDRARMEDLLEAWTVLWPGTWGSDDAAEPKGWFAVCNDDDGIVAYFGKEADAFRFRLAEINRALNG